MYKYYGTNNNFKYYVGVFTVNLLPGVTWINKICFPDAEFAIGAGIERANSAKNCRNIIFVVIILGIVVSILASIIQKASGI